MMFLNDAEYSFEHDVVMSTCDLSNTNMYMYDAVFTWGCFPTYSALPLFHISYCTSTIPLCTFFH